MNVYHLYCLVFQPLVYQQSKPTYHVSVQVSDGSFSSRTAAVTINVVDINNNAPTFSQPMTSVPLSKSVPIGHNVATVTASDADFGDNAEFK